MIDTTTLAQLAKAATPVYPLDERRDHADGTWRCPMCDGQGEVDGAVTLSTSAHYCAGVQVFGIGDEHLALEAFFRAANPGTILALLARLAAAEAVVEEASTVAGPDTGPRALLASLRRLDDTIATYDALRKAQGEA